MKKGAPNVTYHLMICAQDRLEWDVENIGIIQSEPGMNIFYISFQVCIA
ncbi:hypothetical protein D1AOALGA4SA_4211 [Olavius algarvensis Delta 1 endosymbiont]|nr:hypothetical protein D1AOALGA4SA_4211 [Olavius algarvensis Delta 1 endosymbiont]